MKQYLLNKIFSQQNRGKKYSLTLVSQAFSQMNIHIDPQKIVLITGTNGKGTTSCILMNLLLSTGQKTGLFTSPHLVDITERIKINDTPISHDDLERTYDKLHEHIAHLSGFEKLTLCAIDYFFVQHKVDYAIFEIGCGGTLDATNILPHNTSVITSIALDHQHILGTSLQEIAHNKFGIVRDGNSVICSTQAAQFLHYSQNPTCRYLIADEYKLFFQQPDFILQCKYGTITLPLPGHRAAQNCMTALKTFEELGYQPQEHLLAIQRTKWRGRMEQVTITYDKPETVWLSGDHNVSGIQSMLDILAFFQYQTVHFIVGLQEDKEYNDIIDLLIRFSRSKVYLSYAPHNNNEIHTKARTYFGKYQHLFTQDIDQCIQKAISTKNEGDMVVITGSLYLIGYLIQKYSL